jgi:DNA-binding NtrC family response regulator
MRRNILIVHNNHEQNNVLCSVIREKLHYQTVSVGGERAAIAQTLMRSPPSIDLVLFDTSNTSNGCGIVSVLRMLLTQVPVVCMVKYGDYAAALALLQAGAQDFLVKPVAIERLGATLNNALLLRDVQREVQLLRARRPDNTPELAPSPLSGNHSLLPLVDADGDIRRMQDIEAGTIRFAMQYYNGRMSEVARRLGIGRSTLYRKLSELSINMPRRLQEPAAQELS